MKRNIPKMRDGVSRYGTTTMFGKEYACGPDGLSPKMKVPTIVIGDFVDSFSIDELKRTLYRITGVPLRLHDAM